jgi:hypothetical protein
VVEIKYTIGALFTVIFAGAYLLATHYLLQKYAAWVSQLNYGLIIGALLWIMLNVKEDRG